jgi:hypothetical protein
VALWLCAGVDEITERRHLRRGARIERQLRSEWFVRVNRRRAEQHP